MEPVRLFALAFVVLAILIGGIALGLSLRYRKSAAERERERRLKVHAVGRICDGSIEKLSDLEQDGHPVCILHYHYAVSGATYSAAQDVSALRHVLRFENCSEGVPISVKFDPQNPSNSIVVCELWSGLR